MSGFSLIELQATLYRLLSEDAVLVDAGWDVLDYVPEQAPVKYLVLGDDTGQVNDSKTSQGLTIETTIHSWVRARGKLELKVGMERVYELLHDASIEVNGQDVVVSRQEFVTVFKEPDNTTYHGVQRFRFITSPNT